MTPIKVGRQWTNDPREMSLRPFENTQGDYEALAAVRNTTLAATTLPEDYAPMSAAEMQQYYYRADFDLAENAWLVFLKDEAVAAAVVYPTVIFTDRAPGNFDMYVVPQMGRHGIGTRLLAHIEQAALERGHRVLETTVAAEDRQSTAFLEGRGFSVVSHSLHLVLDSLANLPPARVPEDYEVRTLSELQEPPELYMEAANRLGAYDPNYTLIRPEELERATTAPGWDANGVLFALDRARRIVGVIRASASPGSGGQQRGYLNEIRLEATSRGKGLGAAMLGLALQHLSQKGVSYAELDTAGENSPALALAYRAGFHMARHWQHFLKPLQLTETLNTEIPDSEWQ